MQLHLLTPIPKLGSCPKTFLPALHMGNIYKVTKQEKALKLMEIDIQQQIPFL